MRQSWVMTPPGGPISSSGGWNLMSQVEVTYEPQGKQTFRCSPDIHGWDVPDGAELKWEVDVPRGYPQPVFAVDRDKFGSDSRWYWDVHDGSTFGPPLLRADLLLANPQPGVCHSRAAHLPQGADSSPIRGCSAPLMAALRRPHGFRALRFAGRNLAGRSPFEPVL